MPKILPPLRMGQPQQMRVQKGVLLRVWDGTNAAFVLVQGPPE